MRSSPVGSEKALTVSGGKAEAEGLGDVLVTFEGVGEGERDGVLPATGENVGPGLSTPATGDVLTAAEGVGTLDVGTRPHAERTTRQPANVASATRRWRDMRISTCCAM